MKKSMMILFTALALFIVTLPPQFPRTPQAPGEETLDDPAADPAIPNDDGIIDEIRL